MIYLDNASTTKMSQEAMQAYQKYACFDYYNPSSAHKMGFQNSVVLSNAREEMKKLLGAKNNDNLYFCSGATEANNAIIKSQSHKNAKIAISVGEHPSVANVAKELQNQGVEVFWLPLTKDGKVDLQELTKLVNEQKIDFVSTMFASNETGAINDIKQIVKICKNANPNCLVHSDCVQAVGKLNVNFANLGLDYLTLSAHKFAGPKGIGAFVVKNGALFRPLLLGGGQESGKRSGTENLPAIMAMLEATKIAISNLSKNFEYVSNLKSKLVEILSQNKSIIVNSGVDASPYVLSLSIPNIKGEVLVHLMEQNDILIGTGSACSTKKAGNITLSAMGVGQNEIVGSVRVSFSPLNTLEEIEFVGNTMLEKIDYLQKL